MQHLRNSLLCGLLILVSFGPHAWGDEAATETGFVPLFNGQDLGGWKLKRGGEALVGKAEAAGGGLKVAERQLDPWTRRSKGTWSSKPPASWPAICDLSSSFCLARAAITMCFCAA